MKAIDESRYDLRRELEKERVRSDDLERELHIAESAAREAVKREQNKEAAFPRSSQTASPMIGDERRMGELEKKLENAGKQLDKERRTAEAKVRELNNHIQDLKLDIQAMQSRLTESSDKLPSQRSRVDMFGVSILGVIAICHAR